MSPIVTLRSPGSGRDELKPMAVSKRRPCHLLAAPPTGGGRALTRAAQSQTRGAQFTHVADERRLKGD